MAANLILDFLQFIDGQGQQTLAQLLARVLRKIRELTRAEAGTVFILHSRGDRHWLAPACTQNDVIRVRKADFIVPVGPGTISGHVAHSGDTVRIPDVYQIPAGQPYQFNAAFEHPRYRTGSMLCFPLRNYADKVIGVVQLINCRPDRACPPVPFAPEHESLVLPVAKVIGSSIERKAMLEEIREKNARLREHNRVLRQQQTRIAALQAETEEAFRDSVKLLARAAEIHDEDTGNHIVRVNEYSYFLAQALGMPADWCDEIRYSAQLHDVGKMSVDAAVLKKRGPLDEAERAEMNRHTEYGYQILRASPRLRMGAEIALFHHEKWNGTGYPQGLAGEAIPLAARIVQVADVYDALRSARPYKPAFSHERTVDILTHGDARLNPREHFDPAILALFAKRHASFAAIWDRLQD